LVGAQGAQINGQLLVDGTAYGQPLVFNGTGGFNAYNFSDLVMGLSSAPHTFSFQVSGDSGQTAFFSNLDVTAFQAVPEPSSAILLGLGGNALGCRLAWRRRAKMTLPVGDTCTV
jgi:hypothetical protein